MHNGQVSPCYEAVSMKFVIVDDHKMLRQGLRKVLEEEDGLEYAGEAANGLEGLKLIETVRPDVALVDVMLPDMDGIELTRRSKEQVPETRILVISMLDNRSYVQDALEAGASAYIIKGSGIEDILDALRTVTAGGRFVSPSISLREDLTQ